MYIHNLSKIGVSTQNDTDTDDALHIAHRNPCRDKLAIAVRVAYNENNK